MKQIIFFLILIPILVLQPEKLEVISDWSDYLGKMNWVNAKQKCQSKGMHLPSVKEWQKIYNAGKTNGWKNPNTSNFSVYWTSDEFSGAGALVFSLSDGDTDRYIKELNIHVRCLK